jgi:hypothetical protein
MKIKILIIFSLEHRRSVPEVPVEGPIKTSQKERSHIACSHIQLEVEEQEETEVQDEKEIEDQINMTIHGIFELKK